MAEPSKFLKLCGALFAAALFTFAVPAFAQDAEEEKTEQEEAAPAKKKFERVQVTGSLIRRADFEGVSPVETIDRSSIDDSSHNSVGDMIREMPISSFGSSRESSGGATSGTASINLRGLGDTNTLVLLNGTRLQADGITGAVDVNLIPEIAIEGVEILKDGASATYGSDAIGGVVAYKTRKDFTGVEVSVRQAVTEDKGGDRTDVGIIGGKQFGAFGPFTRGSITAAAQYRNNTKIFARDREFSAPDDKFGVGWSQFGPTPNYRDASGNFNFVDSSCSTGAIVAGDDRYCAYAFGDEATTLPDIEQISGYVSADFEMGSRNKLSISSIVTRKENFWIFAPTVGSPATGFLVPAAQAGTINNGSPLPNAPAGDISYTYRAAALGNRENDTTSDAFTVVTAFEREFGETWQWKTTGSYSESSRTATGTSGYALVDPIQAAVASGAFNPFDSFPNNAALESSRFVPVAETTSNNITADTNVNGELYDFGFGVLSGAFGAQYIHMEYEDRVDPETAAGEVFGSAGSNGGGSRDIGAVYAELGATLGPKWEAQLAARYDRYSDFGDALSPKLGVKYRPTKNLMFRASVGKAFKAPLMTDLYASDSNGFPTFIDHVRCNVAKAAGDPNHPSCGGAQYFVKQSANQNLEAEEAISYGVGVVYEPIKNLAFVVDYWAVDQSNLVGISLEEVTRAESKGVDTVAAGNVTVTRDANQNILEIDAPTQNLQSRVQTGVDFTSTYRFKTSFGRFRLSNNFSYTFNREFEGFPGAGERDFIGDYGLPQWRNAFALNFSPVKKHRISLIANTTAGQKNVRRDGTIPAYTELDLAYNTVFPWWVGGVITVGVRNVLGTTPPFDRNGGASPFNDSLYNVLNRHAYLNYRHSF